MGNESEGGKSREEKGKKNGRKEEEDHVTYCIPIGIKEGE